MKLMPKSSQSMTNDQPFYGWKVLWSNGRDHIVLITKWIKKKRRQLRRLVLSGGLIVAMLAPSSNLGINDSPASLEDRPAIQQALADLGLSPQAVTAAPSFLPDKLDVNSYTTGDQDNSHLAVDDVGNFIIVWESRGSNGTDTDRDSIQARLFDNQGVPKGDQFQVNTYTTDDQRQPSVAMDSDGDFVVAWHSYGSPGTDTDYGSIQG